MIPIGDVIPSRTTPHVSVGLIALNATSLLYQLTLGRTAALASPGDASEADAWMHVFTALFLHSGSLHAGGNMLYLWMFGGSVEDRMGHRRFLAFYLLCGIAAALAQEQVSDASGALPLGSSGAVAGVLGAYLVLYPRSRIVMLLPLPVAWPMTEVPAVMLLGFWFALQLAIGVAPVGPALTPALAALWPHAAGFLLGLTLVRLFRRRERLRVEWWDRGA